jgi:phospholipid transport system substrate-binding protein
MLSNRILLAPLALLAWIAVAAPAAAATGAEGAKAFIQALGDQAVETLKVESGDRRTEKMRALFTSYFAVPEIARWVAGSAWRKATEAERQEYGKLFEDYVVLAYTKRLSTYAGERFQILSTTAEGDAAFSVVSEILSPQGERSTRVDWRVESTGSGFKIQDVVVEGVSLRQTQRSDFQAVVQQRGGAFSGLIEALREKNDQLRRS